MAKSERDQRVDELIGMGKDVMTDIGPYTACKNCGKPFGPKDEPEAIAFGFHRSHPTPQGYWQGPHNQDTVAVSVARERLQKEFGPR